MRDVGFIDFEDAVVFFDCPRIAVCGDHCDECGGLGAIPVYVGTLFANLTTAAGMQAMRNLAREFPYFVDADERVDEFHWYGREHGPRWSPGTGRAAPGWGGESMKPTNAESVDKTAPGWGER